MNVLDLFSGLEGWSAPFRERGHDVVTLDLDPRFGADHQIDFLMVDDLRELERKGRFDVVLASPPCDTFSTGSFRHHWNAETRCERCGRGMVRLSGERWDHDRNGHVPLPRYPYSFMPRTKAAQMGWDLLDHTLDLAQSYAPSVWIMENPRALMRKLVPSAVPRRTVTWCQYGDTVMKPTDLWGGFPATFMPRACKNGDPCHEAAPRGGKDGNAGQEGCRGEGEDSLWAGE